MNNIFSGEDEYLNIADSKGFFKSGYFLENEMILLGMLNLMIECMIENDFCFYCCNNLERQSYICQNVDLCKSALFEGLRNNVAKTMKGLGKDCDKKNFVE